MPRMRSYLQLSLILLALLTACTQPTFFNRPTATPACVGQRGQLTITAPDTDLRVGQPTSITMTLNNTSCTPMGLLLFRLNPNPAEAFESIEPINFPGVAPGGVHVVEFTVIPRQSGEVSLTGTASYEGVTQDGAFYWAAVLTDAPVSITVSD